MSNKQELMALLRSFSENVKKFKRLLSAEKKRTISTMKLIKTNLSSSKYLLDHQDHRQ
jgi:hypothetical protein